MSVLSTCMYVHTCVPSAISGQRRALDPLGLELKMVMSCHVGVETQTRSSPKQQVFLIPEPAFCGKSCIL